ncbi:fibronectin type III domain-containing protein [Parasediminibacterium sp. JCM 36343]|uniref:fibronectin type III domain-containing protein n=1 Tax=Parasediminibacterium sp. JCM 36343 TaxID=3374279 RepID=UPI00397B3C7C
MNKTNQVSHTLGFTKTVKSIFMLFAVLLFTASAFAAAKSWTAGASGLWNTASNWNGGTVPVAGDDVTISGAYTITVSGTAAVANTVTLASGATLFIDGTATGQLTISGSTVTTTGYLNIVTGTTVTNSGTLTITSTVAGKHGVNMAGGTFTSTGSGLTINTSGTGTTAAACFNFSTGATSNTVNLSCSNTTPFTTFAAGNVFIHNGSNITTAIGGTGFTLGTSSTGVGYNLFSLVGNGVTGNTFTINNTATITYYYAYGAASSSVITMTGNNSGAITLTNNGTLSISPASNSTNTTIPLQMKVACNPAGTVTVNNGGTCTLISSGLQSILFRVSGTAAAPLGTCNITNNSGATLNLNTVSSSTGGNGNPFATTAGNSNVAISNAGTINLGNTSNAASVSTLNNSSANLIYGANSLTNTGTMNFYGGGIQANYVPAWGASAPTITNSGSMNFLFGTASTNVIAPGNGYNAGTIYTVNTIVFVNNYQYACTTTGTVSGTTAGTTSAVFPTTQTVGSTVSTGTSAAVFTCIALATVTNKISSTGGTITGYNATFLNNTLDNTGGTLSPSANGAAIGTITLPTSFALTGTYAPQFTSVTAYGKIAGTTLNLTGAAFRFATAATTTGGNTYALTSVNPTGGTGGSYASTDFSGAPTGWVVDYSTAATTGWGAKYYTTPGAPTAATATAGNGQATVTFTAPASTGGGVTSYTVTASSGGFTASGVSSPLTVTGLTNGTAYTFTVTATNPGGTSSASAASNSVTPAATAPSSPTSVSAVAGNTVASVSFTAPGTVGLGATAITTYTVTPSPATSPATFTGSSSPIQVTGLTNGTAYTFTVTATNNASTPATSSASSPSSSITTSAAVSWSGGAGDGLWGSANNWTRASTPTSSGVPGANDDVTIGNFAVTINSSTTALANTVTLSTSGGSLTNAGSLTIVTGSTSATNSLNIITGTTVSNTATLAITSNATGKVGINMAGGTFTSTGSGLTINTAAAATNCINFASGTNTINLSCTNTTPFVAPAGSFVFNQYSSNSTNRTTIGGSGFTLGTPTAGVGYGLIVVGQGYLNVGSSSTTLNTPVITEYYKFASGGNIISVPGTAGSGNIIFTNYGNITVDSAIDNTTNAVYGLNLKAENTGTATFNNYGTYTSISDFTSILLGPGGTPVYNTIGTSVLNNYSGGVLNLNYISPTSGGKGTPINTGGGQNNATITNAGTINLGNSISNLAYTGLNFNSTSSPNFAATNTLTNTGTMNFYCAGFYASYVPSFGTTLFGASGAPAPTITNSTNGVMNFLYNNFRGVSQINGTYSTTTTYAVGALIGGGNYQYVCTFTTGTAAGTSPTFPTTQTVGATVTSGGGTVFTCVALAKITNSGGTIGGYNAQFFPGSLDNTGGTLAPSANGSGVGTITLPASFALTGTYAPQFTSTSAYGTIAGATLGLGGAAFKLTTSATTTGGTSVFLTSANPTGSNFASTDFSGASTGWAINYSTPASGWGVKYYTTPGVPTSVSATAGNAQATVSFTAPASTGGGVTSYMVTSSPGGFTATGVSSPLAVTGLTNGTSYTFTVTATNPGGTSAASAVSNSVSPADIAPASPTSVTAVAGNTVATVSFTAPSTLGGGATSITTYTVTPSPATSPTTFTGSSSPIQITGLTNGTAYTFTVTATNDLGNTSGASSPSSTITPSNTISWSGGASDGQWSSAANWSRSGSPAGSVPGSNDDVVIGNYAVTINSSTTAVANTVTMNISGGSINNAGSLTISGGPTSTTNSLNIITGTSVTNSGTLAITATVATRNGINMAGGTFTSTGSGLTINTSSATGSNCFNLVGGTNAINLSCTNTTPFIALAGNNVIFQNTTSAITTLGGSGFTLGTASTGVAYGIFNVGAGSFTIGSTVAITEYFGYTAAAGSAASVFTNASGTVTVTNNGSITTTQATNNTQTVYGMSLSAASLATATLNNNGTIALNSNSVGFEFRASGTPTSSSTIGTVVFNNNSGATLNLNYSTSSTGGTGNPFSNFAGQQKIAFNNAGTINLGNTGATGSGSSLDNSGFVSPNNLVSSSNALTNTGTINFYGQGISGNYNPAYGGSTPSTITNSTNGVMNFQFGSFSRNTIYVGSNFIASNAYVIGNLVYANNNQFICTTAGTSAASAPSWPTTAGSTVTTGGATFTNITLPTITNNGGTIKGYLATFLPGTLNNTGGILAPSANGSGQGIITLPDNFALTGTFAPQVTSFTAYGKIAGTTLNLSGAALKVTTSATTTAGNIIYLTSANPTGSNFASTDLSGASGWGVYYATPASGWGIKYFTTPGAPTGVVGTAGAGQVSVAFTAPSTGGGVTSYTVTSNPGSFTGTGATSPITVTGLTNGTPYTFTVTATNAAGTGSASAASTAVTPATVPNAPASVADTADDAKAFITYTAPAFNGGAAVIDYTITAIPSSGSPIVMTGITANPYTFTGLTNNTTYTFTVAARNSAGTGATITAPAITPSANTTWNGISWSAGDPDPTQNGIIAANLNGNTFTTCKALTIKSGVTFTLTQPLTITGALVDTGAINGTGTLIFGGTTAQTYTGTGSVGNFTLNNSNGLTITSGNKLNITGVLTLQSGVLTTNGNVVFKSNGIASSGTLAAVPISGSSISGTVTVERYIPKGYRSYRDIVPGVYNAANTLYNTYQESGSYSNSGYGMFITGGTGVAGNTGTANSIDANHFDVSANAVKTAYTYTNGTWATVANTNGLVTPFTGYRLLIRGDRSFNLYGTAIDNTPLGLLMYNATRLRASGTLVTGDVTYSPAGVSNAVTGSTYANSTYGLNNLTDSSFSLVANPYVCPVDWRLLTKDSIENYYYNLDPTLGATGAYVAGNSGSNQYIQAGQAIFIQNKKTFPKYPVIGFTEASKAPSSGHTFVFGNISKLPITLFREEAAGKGTYHKMDVANIVFGNGYSNGYNGNEDVPKLTNSSDNLSIHELSTSKALSIDGRQAATKDDIIAIELAQVSKANYQLQIDATSFNSNNLAPYVYDAYAKTYTALSSSLNTISFAADNTVAASYANRFKIVFKPTVLAVNNINATAILKDGAATVSWNTVGEDKVAGYAIEKSTDGTAYTAIGTATAKNTATAAYSYVDNSVANGTTYYRIKATSADGSIAYSNIISVSKGVGVIYSLYPNPVINGKLNVKLDNVNAGKYTVSIYNSLGQKVYAEVVSHNGGTAMHGLSITEKLANGVYNVTISSVSSKQVVYNGSITVQ